MARTRDLWLINRAWDFYDSFTRVAGQRIYDTCNKSPSLILQVEKMGRLFVITLEGSIYKCKHCQTHFALADHIISKSFHCSHGRAYLFDKVVNVTVGAKEERLMMTGMHTVVDIFCVGCGSIVGWKYEAAHDKTQKYKEGKFILERFKVAGPDGSLYTVSHDDELGSDDEP